MINMAGNTSVPEYAFHRYRNLIIVSAALMYGSVLYLSYLFDQIYLPLLFIGIITVIYFAFLTIKGPYYIFLLVAVGSYLGNLVYLIEDGAIPITIFQIALVLCFFCVAINRLITSNFETKYLGIELELLLFLALIFLSLIYSPNPESGMLYALRLLTLIFTAYLVVNLVEDQKQITGVLSILTFVTVVLALISVRQIILDPATAALDLMTPGILETRASGTQLDPNRFASHFFLPLAFVSSIFLTFKNYLYRIPIFIILCILFLGLLSTYSRSAWVATAIMIVLLAYFQRQLKLFIWVFAGGLLALLLVPDLQYSAMNILERVLNIFAGVSDNSSRIRILLGLAAIGMLFDSYLLGIGFRGFPEAFSNYFSTQASIGVVEPHNIIYTVLAELGVIGFFLFIFIYWKIGQVAYYNIKSSTSDFERSISITLFVTYIAFLIFYQFYGGFLSDNNVWILIGLIFAMKLNRLKSYDSVKGELT